MQLLDLFESTDDVWFHGTPEMQKFKQFEGRTLSVSYITDPKRWKYLQDQMLHVERGGDEYFKLIDEVSKLTARKTVRAPIFFTNKKSVARTYADDRRAFDYEAAEPGIIKARMIPGRTLSIYANGQNFRGISIDAVRHGLAHAGVSADSIDQELDHFMNRIRGDGDKISTNSLAVIVDDLGFEIVDVVGVKDTYMGGGPSATVRMVLNPDLIEIVQDNVS